MGEALIGAHQELEHISGLKWCRGASMAGTPDRGFPYIANEGSNDISAYTIDVMTGSLTPVVGSPFGAGTDPQSLVFFQGWYGEVLLYNAGSANVSAFEVDSSTGALTPVTGSPFPAGNEPQAILVR